MMKDICGINNFAPLVLRGGYSQYCIALSGYVNAWRTFGAFLPALTSAEKSAKGAKSLTLGNAQGKKNKYL